MIALALFIGSKNWANNIGESCSISLDNSYYLFITWTISQKKSGSGKNEQDGNIFPERCIFACIYVD